MEAKLWIPLLFALSVLMPAVYASSIKPISPIATTEGSEVNITCDATITSDFEGIRLKKLVKGTPPFINIVQLQPPNFDQPPTDAVKYQLTKTSLHGFYITIKDVVFEDAARYRCQFVVEDTILQDTTLVIVRAPTIQMMDSITAGESTAITCDSECQVPYDLDADAEKDRFPAIAARIGEVWLSGGTPGNEAGRVQMTWNTTLGAADDQKSLVCKVFTTMPAFEQTANKTLNVLFDVRNIDLAPIKETYAVGEEIACTAEGNPAPTITWTAISTNTMVPNVGANLLIVDKMMGDKQENWKCEATSSKTGTKIEKAITFTVTERTDPVLSTPSPKKTSPTAAIAAGVTVPLVLIIALVVVVIVVILMRKKKQKTDKPPPGDAEGNVSTGPFTNPVAPQDDQNNKPNNKLTDYQSEKPSVPPHQNPYNNKANTYNVGYEPNEDDEDPKMDKSAELARRALTPLPMEEADYDIPYNDERGQPRLADVASHVAPPRGPPPGGLPSGGLPPDQQYSVVHRPPPTPTDYPDMAAAHPGLQQVYNMPKPRAVPRQPADTTV